MENQNNSLKIVLTGLIIATAFYLFLIPKLVTYLDTSSYPIILRFIAFEIVLLVIFYLFVKLIAHKRLTDFSSIRYAIGAWAFYHFIDWAEAPWALSPTEIITKAPAWSVSSDTLGASLLCQCQERVSDMICNLGCFNKVYLIMPLAFLALGLLMFGKEITTFIRNL